MKAVKLAIVDDHDLFARGMKSLLEPFNYIETVITASNGLDFIEQLKTTTTLPDIVLLDLKMPKMDGIETLEHLRRDFPTIKCIILSMHEDEQFVLHLIKMGANGYLIKDSKVLEVKEAIDVVMEKDYYYNDFLLKIMRKGLTNNTKSQKKPKLSNSEELTEREIEVLDLICQQYTTQEIGEKLFLSKRTIEGYRKKLLEKTNTKNTAGLIVTCINRGIIEPKRY
ncbi:MAG: response regulator transcription factor [Flavobacteriales bacterium]|nr:response regulator transcription factor [Flavobacteriales bacterium]